MSDARYRCTACGNLTRFEVTATRTTRSFHHYSLAGELEVEDQEVLAESIDEVQCRWCGHGRSIEEIAESALDDSDPALASTGAEGEPTAT
ncbi:MAG TPA: hypothetical protein VN781_05005 [Acidimicrobiales bacterium]|nr:hypothetical protein [Acidimicrobiales bacterium]